MIITRGFGYYNRIITRGFGFVTSIRERIIGVSRLAKELFLRSIIWR